jgi:hypothetical protein
MNTIQTVLGYMRSIKVQPIRLNDKNRPLEFGGQDLDWRTIAVSTDLFDIQDDLVELRQRIYKCQQRIRHRLEEIRLDTDKQLLVWIPEINRNVWGDPGTYNGSFEWIPDLSGAHLTYAVRCYTDMTLTESSEPIDVKLNSGKTLISVGPKQPIVKDTSVIYEDTVRGFAPLSGKAGVGFEMSIDYALI